MNNRIVYWDLSDFGPTGYDGVSRFVLGLAAGTYKFLNIFLLNPSLKHSPLHHSLAGCTGDVQFLAPPNILPWRQRWDQLLPIPGILFAPGNYHRPCRWPTAVVVHDVIPYEIPYYARFQRCSPSAYAALLQAAHIVFCVSPFTEQRVLSLSPTTKTRVLTPGLFSPTPAVRPLWAPDWPYYLFVGSAEPRKCIEDAIALGSQLNDAGLIVIGKNFGRHRQVAQLLAKWTSNQPHLHQQTCSDAELSWLYQHCRALLYPTRYEGFGLPALECLRAGRPVVARDITAMRDLLRGQAIWHEFTAVENLSQAINGWVATPSLSAHLAHFRWDHAQAQFTAALEPMWTT